MSLPNGTATNGFTGAFAMQSTDAGGTLLYVPSYVLDPTIPDARDLVTLINNVAFPANEVQGTTIGVIRVTCPLIALLQNADWFARAILSGVGDTGANGYFTVTIYADNLGGDGPKTYGRCKFTSLRLRSMFSTQAQQQITFVDFEMLSCDPESTVVTALAAPATGPLNQGKILGFGQSAFSGVSNVVANSLEFSTGLQVIPGNVAGNNAKYPSLPAGLKQNSIDGSIMIRQVRNPTLALDADGTIVTSYGTTGAGIAIATELMPMTTNKRQAGGINYQTRMYRTKSNSGAYPVVVSNL